MKWKNNDTSLVFMMPKKVIDLLGKANKLELRLIMYLFSEISQPFSEKNAAEFLKVSETDILSALSFWRGAGVLSESTPEETDEKDTLETKLTDQKPEVKKPDLSIKYSSTELAQGLKKEEFSSLADFAQRKLGRLFNQTEMSQLYSLYDYSGLPADLIEGIVEYCTSIDKTSMRYIEKTALGMYDDGIQSLKDFEYYMNRKKQRESAENNIKKIIGAENRALTKSEKLHISKWIEDWEIDCELISLSYERTINSISKPSVVYMSKVLESWINSGARTVADVEVLKSKKADSNKTDIDLEDFIEKPDGR